MKKKFEIQYRDPDTEKVIIEELEFEDSTEPHFISAKDWADDYAYGRADKGWYKVKEIT